MVVPLQSLQTYVRFKSMSTAFAKKEFVSIP